ncbi:MAG: rhodanese-like domain-containing protein, partial [Pyrobaculum sp.]
GVEIASLVKAEALATGESLGQVSSQTLQSLAASEKGVEMPILRPLVGMDKEEIVKLAQKIGTYPHSIRVGEYCAIFSKRPRKWASRWEIEEIDLAIYDGVKKAVASARVVRKKELPEVIRSLTPPSDLEITELPPDVIVVDLRDGESYARWHLPGAIRAELDRVLELVDRHGRDKAYVFYCYGGGLSLDVAESLRKLGVKAFSLRLR